MKINNDTNKWNITKEFIINEYVIKKKSLPKIAKELGMSYETLFWYKKKFEIPSYSPSFWMEGQRNSPRTEFKRGQTPWNQGKSFSEEQRKRISFAVKKALEKQSIKEKIQRTQFKKGIIPWNKGKNTGVAPWNKGKKNVYSNETINLIRTARLKQIFPKSSTNAELVLFGILGELNIRFSKHKPIRAICQADAFIKPNIVLFADGDYWHCNPKFYSKPKTEAQFKNIKRDFKENDKLIKEGYIVLRFWEFDLLSKKEDCKEIIKKWIKS